MQNPTEDDAGGSFNSANPYLHFDPSIPISYPPINPPTYPPTTLAQLESLVSFIRACHDPISEAKVQPLPADTGFADFPRWRGPRILVFHEEETNANACWNLIDVFVSSSHGLVTLPDPCVSNIAHKHGVKVLGTFMMGGEEGKKLADQLLSTKGSAQMYAELLMELAIARRFDGWLIKMEVNLDPRQIPHLKGFVSHLSQIMHNSVPGCLVIWYDSVNVDGDLIYQSQLNDKNKAFFDSCDGIFVHYLWKEDFCKLSAEVAGDRKFDVYMGISASRTDTFPDGQRTINVPLDVIKKYDVSVAIFAPGWAYETEQPSDFQAVQNESLGLVESSRRTVQNHFDRIQANSTATVTFQCDQQTPASISINVGNSSTVASLAENTSAAQKVPYGLGYHFVPTDDEIICYLKAKIKNEPIPSAEIHDLNVYQYDPETLVGEYAQHGQKHCYFFTPRERKYPKGNRPDRQARNGFWKANSVVKSVTSQNEVVGFKRTLTFFEGGFSSGVKTSWIMHEYTVEHAPRNKRNANGMTLVDWVMCRISKGGRTARASGENYRQRDNPGSHGMEEDITIPTHDNDNVVAVDHCQRHDNNPVDHGAEVDSSTAIHGNNNAPADQDICNAPVVDQATTAYHSNCDDLTAAAVAAAAAAATWQNIWDDSPLIGEGDSYLLDTWNDAPTLQDTYNSGMIETVC